MKSVPSAGAVIALVFWDMRILLINYLEKGKKLPENTTFAEIEGSDRGKTSWNGPKKVRFHHDNAPADSSRVAEQILTKLRFGVFPHLLYSSDLAL